MSVVDQDRQIGAAVAAVRGDRTQQEVADAMRERGWRWSQATVWSVEQGERPLRLTEALELARVFGIDVDKFFPQPIDSSLDDMDALLSELESVQGTLDVSMDIRERIKADLELAQRAVDDHRKSLGSISAQLGQLYVRKSSLLTALRDLEGDDGQH